MAKFTGRFITKQTMESEINKYLYIRDKTFAAITAAITPIANAEPNQVAVDAMKAHFSGTETSFIFDKSTIKAFITLLESGDSNALRIYLGAKADNDNEPGVTKGARTLVIVPAKVTYDEHTDEITGVDNRLFNDVLAALEYPGGVKAPLPYTPYLGTDFKPGTDITHQLKGQLSERM